MILDRFYPTDEAFIEEVFSKILPEKYSCEVVTLARTTLEKKTSMKRWNKSGLLLYNLFKSPSFFWKRFYNLKILFDCITISREKKIDIVVVRNWEWASIIALILRTLFRVQYVYLRTYPQDFNYRQVLKNNISIRLRLTTNILLKLYPYLIRKSDCVFVMSEEMKRVMIEEGYISEKLHVLSLAFNKNIKIEEQKIIEIKEKYKLDGYRIIIYLGKMDKTRELEFLIDIFYKLLLKYPNIRLLMLGGNPSDITRLKKHSYKYKIDDKVIFAGSVLRSEVPNYLSISYCSVSPIPPIPKYTVSSVTKLYESLGQGIPVVGNNLPEQGMILDKSKGGISVDYNHEEFLSAISSLFENTELRDEMSKNGSDYVAQNHTYEQRAEKVFNIFLNLIKLKNA